MSYFDEYKWNRHVNPLLKKNTKLKYLLLVQNDVL